MWCRRATSVLLLVISLAACDRGPVATAPSSALPVTASPISSLGTYEMTFRADPTCQALPQHARSRTYSAGLSAGSASATLTGAQFVWTDVVYPYWNVLYTRVEADLADIWFQDPPIWESLPDESYLVIYGDAHGRLGSETSTLQFWGWFEYCPKRERDNYPECEVPVMACESSNHQLVLRRR